LKQSQPNQASVALTDAERYRSDPTRRWPTRHRGISYRVTASLERRYFVFDRNKFVPTGTTEREALAKQAEIRGKRARGERVVVASRIELKSVAEEWYADAVRRLRPSTAGDYRRYLDQAILPRFGIRGIGSISPQDLLEVIEELEKKGKSSSTIANTLKPLRATLEFAVFKGLIAVNPFAQIPRGYRPSSNTKREHREWTTAEVDRLIEAARKLDGRPEARRSYALAIELMLRTGLRLGECLGLRFGDIDFEQGVINIRHSWGKDNTLGPVKTTSSERRVPVTPGLLKQLAARSLELDADPETFVFATKKGENPPTQTNFRRRGWAPAVKKAGLTDGPKVTPHDARHAFASQLADLSLTSSDLAAILGHRTPQIRVFCHSGG
jgi:integrase